MTRLYFFVLLAVGSLQALHAQEREDGTGGWYAYVFNTAFGDSQFGIAGDLQHRNYKVADDFQQWIIRAGITYEPKNIGVTFVAGYAYFNSGTLGESNLQNHENRLYQDAILKQKLGSRVYLGHRFRLEERFVHGQDFRTRIRYQLAMRIPFNKKELTKNAVFFTANNEFFINGQKQIGDGREVNFFDRDWLAGGLGYVISDKIRLELTYMQETTEVRNKGQLWLALFQKF